MNNFYMSEEEFKMVMGNMSANDFEIKINETAGKLLNVIKESGLTHKQAEFALKYASDHLGYFSHF